MEAEGGGVCLPAKEVPGGEGKSPPPQKKNIGTSSRNDITLIRLSRPAVLNDKVKLACLPPRGDVPPNYDPCYITGWGTLYSRSWLGVCGER